MRWRRMRNLFDPPLVDDRGQRHIALAITHRDRADRSSSPSLWTNSLSRRGAARSLPSRSTRFAAGVFHDTAVVACHSSPVFRTRPHLECRTRSGRGRGDLGSQRNEGYPPPDGRASRTTCRDRSRPSRRRNTQSFGGSLGTRDHRLSDGRRPTAPGNQLPSNRRGCRGSPPSDESGRVERYLLLGYRAATPS